MWGGRGVTVKCEAAGCHDCKFEANGGLVVWDNKSRRRADARPVREQNATLRSGRPNHCAWGGVGPAVEVCDAVRAVERKPAAVEACCGGHGHPCWRSMPGRACVVAGHGCRAWLVPVFRIDPGGDVAGP